MTRRGPRLLLLLLLAAAPAAAADRDASVDAALERAKELRKTYDVREAEAIYRGILTDHPDEPKALLGLAHSLAAVGEQPRAVALCRRIAALVPESPEPWEALGDFSIYLDRREEARGFYEEALTRDPGHADSLAGLARVEIEEGRYGEADALLRRAERADPDDTTVLGARSEYRYRTGDMDGSARLLRRILELEPGNVGAVHRLSNGFVEPGRERFERPAVPPEYDRKVKAAEALYADVDLKAADAAFAKLDTEDAPDARPAFFRAVIALRSGDPAIAAAHAARALSKEPSNPLVGNAYGVAMAEKLKAQRPEYGGGADGVDRLAPFRGLRDGAAAPLTAEIVLGYHRLLPEERRIVDAAVRPFAARLPRLVKAGVTHEILGFEDWICDAPSRRNLAQGRSADGRWYGGLRGVGGRNAATGLEAILAAQEHRFDTFAHEFAHQVHRFGLTEAETAEIRRLHAAARTSGRCLDFYAASNEWEYFAQGYEAFVSPVKSPWQHYLQRHTRAELLARDPALYEAIRKLTRTPDPDPALEPFARPIVAFYEWAGDAESLAENRVLLAPFLEPAEAPEPR